MLEDFQGAISKLDSILKRYEEINFSLSDPDILNNQNKYKSLNKELSLIEEVTSEYIKFKEMIKQYEDALSLRETESDPELKAMALEESLSLKPQIEELKQALKYLLIPKDPIASKNIIVEIRAGTGGEEAALFAMELYRMYTRYAEMKNWKTEIIDYNETELGGYKEVVFSMKGSNVYEHMKYESGGHRVQRIPATEGSGRVHTSAVTVAVLPEVEEADVQIRNEDLKIDTMRSGGAGGQHVNKTESAVRITHIPTGIIVKCEEQKSQIKNRAMAMTLLAAKIYEKQQSEIEGERAELRKNQVGSGDRSDKVRTYNYPQNRITDHRINMTIYKLDIFMQGYIDEIIEGLKIHFREESLKDMTLQ